MIKKIRNWIKKTEYNRKLFIVLSIILAELIWFVPYFILCLIKYGWFGTIPYYYVF